MNELHRLFVVCVAAFLPWMLPAQGFSYDDGLPRSTPEAEGIRSEAVADVFKAVADAGYEVHGLMILRHDKVIAEHWWQPYGPEQPHAMYSATKSFTAAAIGFAVQEGLLQVSDKVMSFFPDLLPQKQPEALSRLTVEHLLTMSAGHERMTYPGSGDDQVRSFLAMDYAHEPGTVFAYNITCSHMLSNIITRLTGLTLYEYLKPRLLDPLGIRDVVWEMDLDGRNMGNGGMHSKTSDLAKFGIFLKNGGKWQGRQLLDPKWVEAMTTPHIYQHPERSDEENDLDDSGKGYGYQVWMGRHHSYRAIGAQTQMSMVLPDQDMVIAVNGSIGDEAGFNTILFRLLDGISDRKLKPSRTLDLAAEVGRYEHPLPFSTQDPAFVLKSRTLRYRMHQNAYGIEGLSFRFDAEGNMYLTLEGKTSVHNIPFGLDGWKRGATDRTLFFGGAIYPNLMGTTPVTTGGCCAWTGKDELTARYVSLFNNGCQETFRFLFSGDRNELTVTVVAPQGRVRPGGPAGAPRDIVLTATRILSTY